MTDLNRSTEGDAVFADAELEFLIRTAVPSATREALDERILARLRRPPLRLRFLRLSAGFLLLVAIASAFVFLAHKAGWIANPTHRAEPLSNPETTTPPPATSFPRSEKEEALPAPTPTPLVPSLRVVRAEDRAPIAGATVAWTDWNSVCFFHRGRFDELGKDDPLMLAVDLELDRYPAALRSPLSALAETKSDAEGRFHLEAPDNPMVVLAVTSEGRAPLLIERRHVPESGDLVLVDADLVRFTITDDTGHPLRGGALFADVEFRVPVPLSTSGAYARFSVAIESDSSFELDRSSLDTLAIHLRCEGYAPLLKRVDLDPGVREIRIPLTPTDAIAGYVVDESGQPISNATISVHSKKKRFLVTEKQRMRTLITDNDGWFRIGVVGANIEVAAEAKGFETVRRSDIQLGDQNVEIRLPQARAGTISGRVSHADGRPIGNARLKAWCRSAVDHRDVPGSTDAEGRYAFDNLRAGTYQIIYLREREGESTLGPTPPGHVHRIPLASQKVELEPGASLTGVDIVVPEGGEIRGRVLDENGEGSFTSFISLVHPKAAPPGYDFLADTATDREGRFHFAGIPPGRYAVTTLSNSALALVTVAAGEVSEVTLGGAKSILRGEVRADGSPVLGAEITAGRITPTGLSANDATTDSEGRFEFKDIPAGDLILRITDKTRGRIFFTQARASSDNLSIEWPTHRIQGTVPAPNASAGITVTCILTSIAGIDLAALVPSPLRTVAATKTDAVGHFTLEGLSAATYLLETEINGQRLSRPVRVAESLTRIELR